MDMSANVAHVRFVSKPGYVNQRDLVCIERVCGGRYGVRIVETTMGLWTLELKFEGEQKAYELQNRRGVLRVWRSLSSVIAFAQAHCCSAAEVLVEVRGWRLMKLQEFILD